MKELKLYVWDDDVLTGYYSGMICALAENVHQARRLVESKMGCKCKDLKKPYKIIKNPYAFYVYGRD